MYDLIQIKKESEAALQSLIKSPTNSWHQFGVRVLIRKDGNSGNYWIRGDHPAGEGAFYLSASDLPALAVAIQGLSTDHIAKTVDELKEEVESEVTGKNWHKQKTK